MKNFKISFLAIFLCSLLAWGNTNPLAQNDPHIGDTLIVKESLGENYNHINFPRLNMIIKRGGVGTYKSVVNVPVIITKIVDSKDGSTVVQLERADGKKFFNQTKYVTATYEDAISSGELKVKS